MFALPWQTRDSTSIWRSVRSDTWLSFTPFAAMATDAGLVADRVAGLTLPSSTLFSTLISTRGGGRLGHEAHGARIHRAAHACGVVERGEHDDGQHRKALAQLADEREAAHAGQRHVEQHEIQIRIGCRGSESFLGRSGRDDPDSMAEPFEGRGNSFQDERMIVDD